LDFNLVLNASAARRCGAIAGFIIAIAFCTAACGEKKVPLAQRTDTADWNISSCSLSYKNYQLLLGAAVADWEQVLGEHDRYVNDMYIFDHHGLKLYERDGKVVTMVLVYKNPPGYKAEFIETEKSDSTRSFYESANAARPVNEYQGLVDVDGGIVKPELNIEEFNRQRIKKNPQANVFTEAYLPTIFHLYRYCDAQESLLNYVGMRIEFQQNSRTDVQQFAFGGEVREQVGEGSSGSMPKD
jgi:hypothetical protein